MAAMNNWRLELADILDRLGTKVRSKPLTFKNIDELIFQLRKRPVKSTSPARKEYLKLKARERRARQKAEKS